MNSTYATDNRRILVIDDNVSIHEDFRKVLLPPKDADSLGQARAALFGEVPTLPPQVEYELKFASQGREGFDLAQAAHQRGAPYAVAFVDMRMPPGWDGLETVEHLWHVDPDLHIVICSAYSDHPWEEVSRRIGETDKVLVLLKPFNSIEVIQLANALTKKWNLARAVKLQIDSLAFSVSQRTVELQAANARLQAHVDARTLDTVPTPSKNELEEICRQKEEFLAIMSHEILTPMNELVSKVSLLLDSSLSSGQREHAMTLQRCAQDLSSLINDMHQFMVGRKQESQTRGGT